MNIGTKNMSPTSIQIKYLSYLKISSTHGSERYMHVLVDESIGKD